MGKIRFTLTNIIFWGILVLTSFLFEFISNGICFAHSTFNYPAIYLTSGAIIIMLIIYFVSEHKRNKMTVDKLLLPVFLILAATTITRIWLLKDVSFSYGEGGYYEATYPLEKKIIFTLITIFTLFMGYMLAFTFSKNRVSTKKLNWLSYILIIFVLIAFGLSFYLDKNFYHYLITPGEITTDLDYIKSIFSNRNAFGYFALLAMMCCVLLSLRKRFWFLYVLMPIFWLISILTGCVTASLLTTILLIVFFFLEIFRGYKSHVARSTIQLILFLLSVSGIVVVCILSYTNDFGPLSKIVRTFWKQFSGKDFSTFTKRTIVWQATFQYIFANPINLFLGMGAFGGQELYYGITLQIGNPVYGSHNGFIQVLTDFGILGLIFYIVLMVFIITWIVKLYKTGNKRFATNYLICVIVFICYSMFEATYFFSMNISSLFTTIVVLLPIFQAAKNIKYSQRIEEFNNEEIPSEPVDIKHLTRVLAFILQPLPYLFFLAFFVPNFNNAYPLSIPLVVGVMISLAILAFFLPYLVAMWRKNSTVKSFIAQTVIWSILICLITGIGVLFYLFVPSIKNLLNAEAWFIETFFVGALVFTFFITMIAKRGSFGEWFGNTFLGFFTVSIPSFLMIFIFPIPLVITRNFYVADFVTSICLVIAMLVIYYAFAVIFKTKTTSYTINHFNNYSLSRLQKLSRRNDI